MCANSEVSGETARMRRIAWAFAGRLCDKCHNLMSWLPRYHSVPKGQIKYRSSCYFSDCILGVNPITIINFSSNSMQKHWTSVLLKARLKSLIKLIGAWCSVFGRGLRGSTGRFLLLTCFSFKTPSSLFYNINVDSWCICFLWGCTMNTSSMRTEYINVS